MAFDAGKARVANQLIQDGVPEEQALIQAGVNPDDFDSYSINEIGTPATNPNYGQIQSSSFAGIQSRPDQTAVSPDQDPGIDDEDVFQRVTATSQSTTTTQTTQITGGGSTTRRVVPTQYEDNAASRSLQQEASSLGAQAQARRDAIRAAGGTGADVLRDPEFRRLSNEQTAKEYEAQQARTPVPNTGGIITTTTPGANQTTTTQTVDGNFVTTQGSGFDLQAQAVEANTLGFAPARNFSATDVTADDVAAVRPIEDDIEGGAVGFPEGTFAGDGYGFTYDEDGELIPTDSADTARIRGAAVPQLDPYEVDGFGAGDLTDEEVAQQDGNFVRAPEAPLGLTYQYNDVDGYDIFDADGKYITTVNDEAEAILYIQNAELDSLGFADQESARINTEAAEAQLAGAAGADTKAKLAQAKQQFQLQQRYNQTTQGDWRVTLRLAPGASYLYKAPGIAASDVLSPLAASDGVIFPYTPTITTNYVARYEPYELVHSNYRGFFYKNSHVGEIQINGIFTAQDTAEAQYLLAVIHFFRSCTKMFYGQDPQFRGSPPPLVELSGYGQYQFNNHPCLVSNFNYTLPNGVDYIRVSPNNLSQGLSLANRRQPVSANTVSIDSVVNRLKNSGLLPGAQPQAARSDLGYVAGTTSGTVQTTYVPTKMEIQLTLLPTQTRQQVSQGFSLEEFARGRLLTGGFW